MPISLKLFGNVKDDADQHAHVDITAAWQQGENLEKKRFETSLFFKWDPYGRRHCEASMASQLF